MKNIKEIKIAIVSSSFRKKVSQNLESNCLKTLKEKGLTDTQISLFKVPGSWEIPLLVKKLAQKKAYAAIITFGAIVKGQTYHFEQIGSEVARSLMQISLDYQIPVIFEVLAVYKIQDAYDRAETKGVEAALTALEMIKTISKL